MTSQAFQNLLSQFRAAPLDPHVGLSGLRSAFDTMGFSLSPPSDASFADVDAGGVPAEWVRASDGDVLGTMLYLHGGGYIFGSRKTHRNLVARLCKAANVRALSIDYRLAPEHPFPAAIEDAVSSYHWLVKQGVEPSQIIIAGDSAGGGLTLATLLSLRDAGAPLPAAAVCLSPCTDHAQTGESIRTKADVDPLISSELITVCTQHYLRSSVDVRNPLASPLYATLTGLPPMLIMVGSAEVLLDDSVRLADKARAQGVDADLVVADDMTHTWPFFAGAFPEAQEGVELIASYIRRQLS